MYRGTLQELYERAVDNWVAEKRGSPSVAPSVYARPETRCVRRCRGRACASLRQPRERVEGGEGRASGGGYAAAALERRVAPGKRMRGQLHDPASAHATSSPANSRDITCYHPGSKVTELRCPVPPSLSRSRSSFSGMIRRNDDAGTTFFFSFALRKHFFLRNEEFKISLELESEKQKKGKIHTVYFPSQKLSPPSFSSPGTRVPIDINLPRLHRLDLSRINAVKSGGNRRFRHGLPSQQGPPQPEEEGSAQEQRLIAISNTLILYLHDPPSLPAPEYPHNTSHSDIDRVGRELRSKRASDHISKKLIPSCTPIPDKFEVNQTSELNQFSLNLHSRMKGSIQQRITSCDEKSLISISLFLSLSRRRRRNVSSLFLSLSRVGSHVLELM